MAMASAAAAGSPQQTFTIEDAKLALQEILRAYKQPENARSLKEAWEGTGNDMLKMMQFVFPMATQIQMEVLEKYGFPADGDGIVRFVQTVKHYEKQDAEVAQLNAQVRNIIMPHMAAPQPEPPVTIAT